MEMTFSPRNHHFPSPVLTDAPAYKAILRVPTAAATVYLSLIYLLTPTRLKQQDAFRRSLRSDLNHWCLRPSSELPRGFPQLTQKLYESIMAQSVGLMNF